MRHIGHVALSHYGDDGARTSWTRSMSNTVRVRASIIRIWTVFCTKIRVGWMSRRCRKMAFSISGSKNALRWVEQSDSLEKRIADRLTYDV